MALFSCKPPDAGYLQWMEKMLWKGKLGAAFSSLESHPDATEINSKIPFDFQWEKDRVPYLQAD